MDGGGEAEELTLGEGGQRENERRFHRKKKAEDFRQRAPKTSNEGSGRAMTEWGLRGS